MAQNYYYVDTCIWLNIFQKEDRFLKSSKEFFNKTIKSDEYVYYSKIVLREIKYILNDEPKFLKNLAMMKIMPNYRYVEILKEDYDLARKLESESSFDISFYDCIHISICKRLNLILVTRDRKLLEFSKEYITSDKPENLLH